MFPPSITIPERVLIYYAVTLIILCKYKVKTTRTIIYSAIRHDSMGTKSIPKTYLILNDSFKGASKVFRQDFKNRFIMSPDLAKIYNATMNSTSNILENALVGADALAIVGILRSGEYLFKSKLEPVRRNAQKLILKKISDPCNSLNLLSHRMIVSRIKFWLETKPKYLPHNCSQNGFCP